MWESRQLAHVGGSSRVFGQFLPKCTLGAFDTPGSVSAVKTGVSEPLTGKALGRVGRFVRFNFYGHVEKRVFVENLFTGRRRGKSHHVEGEFSSCIAELTN